MRLYGTPWARPGGMWCGDPPPWYFEQRDVAADLLGSVLAIGPRAAAAAEHEVAASAVANWSHQGTAPSPFFKNV